MYMENLPDGMHGVLVSVHGGLYIAGFDSRRRVCLVLFAPPFGNPLRTVSELPYRDYGRFTPTVRAAKDPARADNLYVLLYLHPDNLGLMQTSLYRIDVLTGRQVLLTASSSPFWAPEGMLPRADGTVLVALGGLGPLLVYNDCDEKKCSPYKEVVSNASDAPGKGGLADVDGMLCLVEGSTAVYGEGGKLVCEIYDGSLLPIANTRKPDHAQGWEVGGAQPYDGEYDDAYDLGVGNYSGSSSAGMGSGRDSSGRADVADSGKAAGGDGSSHRAPGLGSARLKRIRR